MRSCTCATRARTLSPTCGAARPRPFAACMVASMSSSSRWTSRVTLPSGFSLRRSTEALGLSTVMISSAVAVAMPFLTIAWGPEGFNAVRSAARPCRRLKPAGALTRSLLRVVQRHEHRRRAREAGACRTDERAVVIGAPGKTEHLEVLLRERMGVVRGRVPEGIGHGDDAQEIRDALNRRHLGVPVFAGIPPNP